MAKRDDLIRGALEVFARDGYANARVVEIAAEANVSTRTIYNLFQDKPGLFAAVVEHVGREFVGSRLKTIEDELSGGGPIAEVLTAFAHRWLTQSQDLAVYLQLASRIQADRAQVPQEILDRGMKIGPERVQRALATQLQRFMYAGSLRTADPHVAALHLLQLVEGVPEIRGYYAATGPSSDELREVAAQSIHAYLHGYAIAPSD